MVIASPIEKRRDEFLEDLAWVVRETANKVDDFQPEKLAQNETFVSATLQAARIAVSTHQREKRQYLRNALLHVAVGDGVGEIKQQVFLNALEVLTPAHVRALDLIWRGAGKKIPWEEHSIPLQQRTYGTAIWIVAPELKGQQSIIGAVLSELRNRGFSVLPDPEASFPAGQMITNLGIEFLTFILSPEELS